MVAKAIGADDLPEHRSVRVGKLETIGQCKSELAKVYRSMRRGTLATSDGTRMAMVLQAIMSAVRDYEFEVRLHELETTARTNPTELPMLEVLEVAARIGHERQ